MKPWTRRSLFAVAVTAALVTPTAALACGALLSDDGEAESTEFAAVLAHDGAGTEDLTVTIDYTGTDGDDFAWVMAFPSPPQVEPGDETLVRRMLEASEAPDRRDEVPSVIPLVCACGAGSEDTAGVEVLDQQVAGDLEFTTLTSDSLDALTRFMDKRGLEFHDRQEPTLQRYLDKGWVFVTAEPTGDAPEEGRLAAVRFRFQTEDPVYPLALASADHEEPLRMLLLTLTPYRPALGGYEAQVVRPDEDGYFGAPGEQPELRYSAPLENEHVDPQRGGEDADVEPIGLPEGEVWLSRFEAAFPPEYLENDITLTRAGTQEALDYSDLLASYRGDRMWARVGQGFFTFILLTPVVLFLAGFVVLLAGLIRRGFHRRA